MKTKIYLLGLIMLFVSSLNAQETETKAVKKGDCNISVNASYLTPYTFNSSYASSGAPIGLGFGVAVSNRLVVGAEFGLFSLKTTDKNVDAVHGTTSQGADTITANAYSYNVSVLAFYFLGNMQYHWLNKEKFSLYSGIGLGYWTGTPVINYSDGNGNRNVSLDSYTGVAYQITAIGIRSYFGKHFGIHVEAGYGIKGIAGGGLDIKF